MILYDSQSGFDENDFNYNQECQKLRQAFYLCRISAGKCYNIIHSDNFSGDDAFCKRV